jgi:hypothetical protein
MSAPQLQRNWGLPERKEVSRVRDSRDLEKNTSKMDLFYRVECPKRCFSKEATMFSRIGSRLAGGSLALLAVVVSIWALTSIVCAGDDSSVLQVSGAATMTGCKEPCNDGLTETVKECLHLEGHASCEEDRCTINTLRYLKCEVGDSCDNECEYYIDNNDWGRQSDVRYMSCNSTVDKEGLYGDCAWGGTGGQHKGWHTPCFIESCSGEIDENQSQTYPGRVRCGEEP